MSRFLVFLSPEECGGCVPFKDCEASSIINVETKSKATSPKTIKDIEQWGFSLFGQTNGTFFFCASHLHLITVPSNMHHWPGPVTFHDDVDLAVGCVGLSQTWCSIRMKVIFRGVLSKIKLVILFLILRLWRES